MACVNYGGGINRVNNRICAPCPYGNEDDDDDEEEDDSDEEDDSNDHSNGCQQRGSVAFFSTYRTPVPMDIYSSPINPGSCDDEHSMIDGKSYNYNGRDIPPNALKTLLKYTEMGRRARARDVDDGTVTGLVFVSERTNSLETLHFALLKDGRKTEVFNFAQLYHKDKQGHTVFRGVRMEDSGCFAGDRCC